MAANSANVAAIVSPYQGNIYDVQTKQALAQALMKQGMTGGVENYRPAGGGYQYVPTYGIGAGLTQLASMLGGALLQKQASQELSDISARQYAALTGEGLPQAQSGPTAEQLATAMGGGGGPTNANAANLAQAMTPQASVQRQPAPLAPGGTLNPSGAPTSLAYQAYQLDPAGYTAKAMEYYKPADIVAKLRAAGIDPNSTIGQQIVQQNLAKENYIPQQAFSPGQTVFNPATGKSEVVPNVGEGMEVVTRSDGSKVVIPIPGYAGATETIAGAKARGLAQGEVQQVYNPVTQQMEIVPKFTVLGGGQQGGGLGSGRMSGGGGGFAAGPSLGTAEAAATEGRQQAEQGLKTQEQAGAAPNQRLFLGELRQTLNEFKSGDPNADWKLTAKKLANANSPFGNVFDPKAIASQEMFNKAAGQLAMQQFKDLGSGGAQSTLETAIKTNPNQALSQLGNKGIIDLLSGNVDAQEKKGEAWQAWKDQNGPGSYSKFQTEWNKRYDPRLFMIPYQSKEEAKKMVDSMPANERKVFQQKFNFAVQNGWIQLPGQ